MMRSVLLNRLVLMPLLLTAPSLAYAQTAADAEVPVVIDPNVTAQKATETPSSKTPPPAALPITGQEGKPAAVAGATPETAHNSWATSIMFSLSDLRKLKDVLVSMGHAPVSLPSEGLDEASSPDDAEMELPETPAAPVSDTPAYYLSSILYKSPSEWSVWINGTPFDPLNSPQGLSIREVNKKYVRFVWTPVSMPVLMPRWQEALTRLDSEIKLDTTAGTVAFTLQPNQSFVGRTLEIIEGRSLDAVPTQPVSAPTGGADPKAAAIPNPAVPSDPSAPDTGIEAPVPPVPNPSAEELSGDAPKENGLAGVKDGLQNAMDKFRDLTEQKP